MADVSDITEVSEPLSGRAILWMVIYALVLGAVGAVAGLVFLGVTGIGATWYGEPGLGWFEGPIWWVAVAAGAGLLVGLLRRAFHMPSETPGVIEDLQREHIDFARVPSIVAVSAVSLIGGASLGPEVALGQMGGGAGGWIAKRRELDDDNTKSLTLAGMAGAFGGLFSSPLLAIILVVEIARPAWRRYQRVFLGSLISSSVAFGIYFVIVGSVFLGIYEVPQFEFEVWHLLAAIGLGLGATVVALGTAILTRSTSKLFTKVPGPEISKPVIAGVAFGLIGVALPLTNFTGSDQLGIVLDNTGALGVGLLAAILLGKALAFSLSTAGGFIGGPIFPVLFLGGTAGVLVNALWPGIPLGLAFASMLAAVAGAAISAPFTMVLLAALLTQIGALHTAPVLIAVATAQVAVMGIQRLMNKRREEPAT
jgi:H+/Cl- antiporter ClcA